MIGCGHCDEPIGWVGLLLRGEQEQVYGMGMELPQATISGNRTRSSPHRMKHGDGYALFRKGGEKQGKCERS